jgi:glutamate/tyrosine decarboxylase-like PLP-dependent enzyme
VLYVSAEGHGSVGRAARLCGLGDEAVRLVPTDRDWRMDPAALEELLSRDRRAGASPFLLVATVGTTAAGAVDPLRALSEIAEREELWLHVDAAWGGAAALVPELRPWLAGIERADSIAFDAHKWLSVPMGAGFYLTRHRGTLERAFAVSDDGVPRRPGWEVVDPCRRSMAWSRRFAGLKVLLSLAVAGKDGYAAVLRHQVALADALRHDLERAGWGVVNRTFLPLVCFVDRSVPEGRSASYLEGIAGSVIASGAARISVVRLGDMPALRACISSFRTAEEDLQALIGCLAAARRSPERVGRF